MVEMAGWVDTLSAQPSGGPVMGNKRGGEREREKGSKRKAWGWLFVVVVVEEYLGGTKPAW